MRRVCQRPLSHSVFLFEPKPTKPFGDQGVENPNMITLVEVAEIREYEESGSLELKERQVWFELSGD